MVSRVRLPAGINGIELVDILRHCQPEVGIMITHGRTLPPDADLPADAVLLPKPYTAHQFTSTLENLAQRTG